MGNIDESLIERVKQVFGELRFEQIKEFFKQVNSSDYDVKILITRRAYVLYKLFTKILETEVEFEKKGVFLNTHSIIFLKSYSNGKVLLIDDVVINGRTITKWYNQIDSMLCNSKIDIWCLGLQKDAKCLNINLETFKVYWLMDDIGWKDESSKIAKAILEFDYGYTSFVNTYEIDADLDTIYKHKAFKNNKKLKKGDSAIIFLGKSNGATNYTKALRLRKMKNSCNKTIFIPYLFLPSIKNNEILEKTSKILQENGIEGFSINYNENIDLNIYLYKKTIYLVSKKIKETYDSDFKITNLLDCSNESFPSVPSPSFDVYKKENEKFSFFDVSDIDKCSKKFKEAYRENVSIENIYEITGENIKFPRDIYSLPYYIEKYLTVMRIADEERAKNGLSRHIGIRVEDIIKVLEANKNTDKDDTRLFLYLFISNIWDNGNGSGIVEAYKTTNQEIEISEFLRHGEQAFIIPYDLNLNVFYYFSQFVIMTGICDTERIEAFAKFIDKKYNTEEFCNFFKCIFCDLKISPKHFLNDALVISNSNKFKNLTINNQKYNTVTKYINDKINQ